ncbi:MAG: DUF433 domain-containing protein [Chloroflexi bacterium]|nr:DUF433 domain-containing protein [Chloroflexota bacterium]
MTTPRISVNPNVQHGKPCVAGTRIPVHMVQEPVRYQLALSAPGQRSPI